MKVNLPPDFVSHIKSLLNEEAEELLNSFSSTPPVSIRLNPKKDYLPPPDLERIPWCKTGYYLPARPVFTLDPAFHGGGYYVQEASSMFLEQAIKKINAHMSPLKVLDLSAAPGGKSTHLLSLLNENCLLVANEVIRSRAEILKENIIRWGYPNVIITSSDPEKFSSLKNFFDVILVDAPCSGEGLLRKDNKAIDEWSPGNVQLCAARQKRILNNIWPALKNSGYLIYSTCTFQNTENEEQIINLINNNDAEPVSLDDIDFEGVAKTLYNTSKGGMESYRFYPHKVRGEGFFLSVTKKLHASPEEKIYSNKKKIKEVENDFSQYVSEQGRFIFFDHNNSIFAFPEKNMDDLIFLSDKLNIIYAGVEVGKFAGKDLIPAHALAVSTIVSEEIPSLEVSTETAIQYLRKSEIKFAAMPGGWMVIKHNNLNLGWIKVLSNRINNFMHLQQM